MSSRHHRSVSLSPTSAKFTRLLSALQDLTKDVVLRTNLNRMIMHLNLDRQEASPYSELSVHTRLLGIEASQVKREHITMHGHSRP
mmetsp:Transcript_27129/g.65555  ORF Transcript_27129/g.65555 Transcript_27129/m.65555 type:complete len:86 (-) Transcript_27129:205-462(-)